MTPNTAFARKGYLLALTLAVAAGSAIAAEPDPAPVRIGMLATMFRSRKPELFTAFKNPFGALVKTQTGFTGRIDLARDPDHLAEQLSRGTLQFGLCHGFEFAWMRQKDPKLIPLMVAAPSHRPLKAFVVVASRSPVKTLCDLSGKNVALPHGLHETARLFADRLCRCEGKPLSEFAGRVTEPANAETALHEVFDDKVQAAIVDGLGLQCFEERYPARSKRLRILVESPAFPMTVVTVREGAVDEAIRKRFQAGMSKAHTTPMGRQLIALMQSAGFEAVPADYDRQVERTLELFPAPKQ